MNDITRFSEESIFISYDSRCIRVNFSDILYIEAKGSDCIIGLVDKELKVCEVLRRVEECLPTTIFLRIHRSYIVNKQYISEFLGNSLRIEKKSFPIGSTYRKEIMDLFHFLPHTKR